jgi:hypothetical protein
MVMLSTVKLERGLRTMQPSQADTPSSERVMDCGEHVQCSQQNGQLLATGNATAIRKVTRASDAVIFPEPSVSQTQGEHS